MSARIGLALVFGAAVLLEARLPACCPAPPAGKPVVNADQTVILLWDAERRTQHFIRKATFQSDAEDFGFIVPSPSQPELEEAGGDAFPYLLDLTRPEVRRVLPQVNFTCAMAMHEPASGGLAWDRVRVLQEKEVAGFNAVVLEAGSCGALVTWLREHGYAYSPEVETWAKPYVDEGWKFTALKVAKDRSNGGKAVAAAALRISFRTECPLFPYREPDPRAAARALGAKDRLLRIYFIAEGRYRGELTKRSVFPNVMTPLYPTRRWTGQVAWSDRLTPAARARLLELLRLPADTGPKTFWLTEYEDRWPYEAAPADVYFSRDPDQRTRHRPVQYVAMAWAGDASVYALGAAVVLPPLVRRARRRRPAVGGSGLR
jgi:hypothetical protein